MHVVASFICEELASYTIIHLLLLHRSNLSLCSWSLNVSANFCTLNEARLRSVVGMQRLRAPAMRAFAYWVDTRRSRSRTSSTDDSRMFTICCGVAIVGPDVWRLLVTFAGKVSARAPVRWVASREAVGGNEGRGCLSSANSATSSVRPNPSRSRKPAGDSLRGRSGNRCDSVDKRRLGDRGLGRHSQFSSLTSLTPAVDCSGGVVTGFGENGVRTDPTKGPLGSLGDEEVDAPRSKAPKVKPLLFSDCLLNSANSGFWSTGMTRGESAAVERT
jgi:hypothetical protein